MKLAIPDSAVKYILFQRPPHLLVQQNRWLNPILIRLPISYNSYVGMEAALFKGRAKRLYTADIQTEFDSILKHLPEHAGLILDIGCGLAAIDVMLARHFEKDSPQVYLFDKSEINAKVYYGFEEQSAFYSSLSEARLVLEHNGIPAERIHTQEVGPDARIIFDASFDLIVSLISWGFHYPVSTYLADVKRLLKPGGTLILDVRKSVKGVEGEDGLALIKEAFGNAEIIYEEPKHLRIKVQKQ